MFCIFLLFFLLTFASFSRYCAKKPVFVVSSARDRKDGNLTPAFSVTCIGDIFVHLSTCYLNGCLPVNRQFLILLAEEMTNK